LPIWIGQAEARSILFKLQNQEFVRPLTHDLALSLVNELGGSMESITVTELRDSTFFATIRLEIDGKTVEVDSRPSDAIALAIRSGAEIFASDEVIEEAGNGCEDDDEGYEGSTASPSIRRSCSLLPDAPSELPSVRYSGYARRNASTESTSHPTMTSIASPSKRFLIRASLLTLRRTYSQEVSPDLRSSLSV
jgi:bifunctional DNase/RNase